MCWNGGCRPTSPTKLRRLGKCPLTPEEAALVLAGLGFNRETFIYLAGSRIYGGQSRAQTLSSLYPNLVTKEDLLTRGELEPFRNFSSQVNKHLAWPTLSYLIIFQQLFSCQYSIKCIHVKLLNHTSHLLFLRRTGVNPFWHFIEWISIVNDLMCPRKCKLDAFGYWQLFFFTSNRV